MRQAHKFPAPVARPAGYDGGGAFGVAPLGAFGDIKRDAGARPDVNHQPVFGEAQIQPVDAADAANRAVGAVGADNVARLKALALCCRIVALRGGDHHQLAAVGGLAQPFDLAARIAVDVGQGLHLPVEDGLQVRLVEKVAEGAAAYRLRAPVQRQQPPPVGAVPLIR